MDRQEEKDLFKKLVKEGHKPRWIPRMIDQIKADEGKQEEIQEDMMKEKEMMMKKKEMKKMDKKMDKPKKKSKRAYR